MEKLLEEQYIDYCVLICPLENSRSISQSFRRSKVNIPNQFSELEDSVQAFLVEKPKYAEADVKVYLLWKIWQFKMQNLNTIKSDIAKIKAMECKSEFAKEAYKIIAKSEKLLKDVKALPERAELEGIKERFEEAINRLMGLTEIVLAPSQPLNLIEGVENA